MESMEKRVAKMDAQLDRWAIELKDLAVKVDDAGAQAKLDTQRQIHELQAKHHAAKAKLDAARAAGKDKWDDFKTGVDASWGELESAFKKLRH
jgi:multidrug efflux pump subunit AcrA (membrane-fusion protein)